MQTKKFDQFGMLALEPRAFGLEFLVMQAPVEPFRRDGDMAIVDVCGPLMQREDPFCDSYTAITQRMAAAFESDAPTIVMSIDSPGGLVGGCMSTARQLRRMAQASGKKLIAYINEGATSAAYAIASAADEIVLPPTGRVGSIGVIEVLQSFARQAAAAGVDFTVITSGKRKADGNPAVAMTDDARTALQSGVDHMAQAFFELVQEHRGDKLSAVGTDLASLEAAVYYGDAAVTLGLADRVADFDQMKAAHAAQTATEETQPMKMSKAELLAACKALAEEGGEDSPMAQRMLAASEEEAPESEKPAPAAAAEPPPAKAVTENEKPVGAVALAALASTVQSLVADRDAQMSAARATLIASRPDVAPEVIKAFASLDNAALATALGAILKPTPAASAQANVRATATGAGGVGGAGPDLDPSNASAMDRVMGLATTETAHVYENGVLQLGVTRVKGN